MSSHSKNRSTVIGCLALLLVSVSGLITPAAGLETGGDDVIIWSASEGGFVKARALDVLNDGTMFAAGDYENGSTGYEIRIYRSSDSGESWEFWGSLRNGDPDIIYFNPDMLVAEGTQDRLFLAYEYRAPGVNEIRVSSTDPYGASPSWSHQTIVSMSYMWLRYPTLCTDDKNYANYNVYVAYVRNDSDGQDVWFTRTTDFGASWEAPYIAMPSSNSTYDYLRADLADGFGSRVHLVATRKTALVDEGVICHRFAINRATSAGSWDGVITWLSDNTDPYLEMFPKVRASASDDQVLVGYDVFDGQTNLGSILRSSEDGGDTWPAANALDMGEFGVYAIAYDTVAEFAMLVSHSSGRLALATPTTSDLTGLWIMKEFLDERGSEANLPDGALDCDPTHDSRWCAVKAQSYESLHRELHFDGAWRGDAGYPNYENGFPLELADGVLTDPVLANMDGDHNLEIAFTDYAGNLHVLDPNGDELPGWPIQIQAGPTYSTTAVGDIDGDLVNEIVVGNDLGTVYAFEQDGSDLHGWPIDLNISIVNPAMISLGPVTGRSPLDIVVTQENMLHVFDFRGNRASGFPKDLGDRSHAPAAIGDVDDDGDVEIVTAAGSRVLIFSPTGQAERSIIVNGELWNSPSLGDLDFDGDLEIAIPTNDGRVYLKHHGGGDLPGWPFTDPNGDWMSAVAIGNIYGQFHPELIFCAEGGRVFALDAEGNPGFAWPNNIGGSIYGSPIAHNIWGDPGLGVIVGGTDDRLHAWKNTGYDIPGWPKEVFSWVTGTAAAGDIDNDGNLEVVFGTSVSLEIVDLNNPPGDYDDWYWPMAFYDAQRTSCMNCDLDTLTGLEDGGTAQASRVSFLGGFPNPAAADLYLRYQLPAHSAISLCIYDVEGRLIRNLMREEQDAGTQAVCWDGRDNSGVPVSSGVYYARLLVRGPGMQKEMTRAVSIMR